MDTAYNEWLRRVDRAIEAWSGLGVDDLADWLYRDAFDAGADPEDVATEVLEDNGFPFEEDGE